MRIAITIAINDLRVFLTEPANLINLIVLPVVLSLVLGMALSEGEAIETVQVDLIDMDNSAQSEYFINTLRESNRTLRFCPMDDGQKVLDDDKEYDCLLDGVGASEFAMEDSIKRIEDKVTMALIVLPDGYGTSLLNNENVDIEYHSLDDSTSSNGIVQSVQSAVQRINRVEVAVGVGTSMVDALSDTEQAYDDEKRAEFVTTVSGYANDLSNTAATRVSYSMAQEGEEESTPGLGFDQSVPGMATMFVLMTALGGVVILLQDRQQWTLQRLIVMPVSRAQLLGGKILARFTTGMITFAVMVLVGAAIGIDWGNSPLAVLLLMVSYTLCVTALTFAIAPFIRSVEQASGLTVMLSIVLAAVGGAWWPLEIVPDLMQVVGRISPVAWAMDGFNQLVFYEAGLSDVLLDVVVLFAASFVLFVFGIMNFKYE
jgi:ABC-2 type transport system permease protein